MTHLDEEQLTLAYYGEADAESVRHLDECAECKLRHERIKTALDNFPDLPVPERSDAYGSDVWVRLLPQLPVKHRRRNWLNWWTLTPALASLVAIAFFAGMLAQRNRQTPAISAEARERVLLMAMSDHLERSQILLVELAHAVPGENELKAERALARSLVTENRLLRETARSAGDESRAALLDDLERVLVAVANGPARESAEDLDALKARIQSNDLLFKVRVMSANTLQEGRKL
jgi:hypothetical protein